METWKAILLAITGNTVAVAVLGYLAKSLLEKFIARDTKQFEVDLKAKADSTIEQLKNELQIRAIEHQVRFSKLHEKRAEVVAELYRRLRTALWAAEDFLSPMQWAGEPELPAKYATAFNSFGEAYRFFGEHQIYLPYNLCESLEKLIRDARQEVIRLGVWVRYDDNGMLEHAQKNKQETWISAWNAINTEIPKATRALEDEFRYLLSGERLSGHNDPTNSNKEGTQL
jgi:hypothetical protein